jgi:hypothetical protein
MKKNRTRRRKGEEQGEETTIFFFSSIDRQTKILNNKSKQMKIGEYKGKQKAKSMWSI